MSKQVRDELKCGKCGEDKFTLFSLADTGESRFSGDPLFDGSIVVRCVGCGAESTVGTKAALTVDDEGTL